MVRHGKEFTAEKFYGDIVRQCASVKAVRRSARGHKCRPLSARALRLMYWHGHQNRSHQNDCVIAFAVRYKKVDGVMVAYKVTIKHEGEKFVEAATTEAKFAEKLDDRVFAKP